MLCLSCPFDSGRGSPYTLRMHGLSSPIRPERSVAKSKGAFFDYAPTGLRSEPTVSPHRLSRRLVAWLLRLPLKGGVMGGVGIVRDGLRLP